MAPAPTKLRTPTVKPAPPSRRLRPGDLICGDCGEGNTPQRRFCSRCGHSLQTAETVRTPWYRKLLPRRRGKELEAGQRPGRAGAPKLRRGPSLGGLVRRLRAAIALLALLGGLLYGFFTPWREAVNSRVGALEDKVTAQFVTSYDPVSPTSARGTSQRTAHPARAAVDGFKNTFWLAPPRDREPTLVFGFDHPVTLDRVLLRSGSATDFQGQNRPKHLHVVYSTGRTFDVEVKDTPDQQELKLSGGRNVTGVEIHISAVYRSLKGHDVALTEMELFTKR